MHIDVLDYEITIDGKPLRFPMSYEEVKSVMGEASRVIEEDWGTLYMYDDKGLFFEDHNSPKFLKKQKAYIDEDHRITSLSLYVTDKQDLLQKMVKHKDPDFYPHSFFVGNVTFLGWQREKGSLNQRFGCYQEFINYPDGSFEKYTYDDHHRPLKHTDENAILCVAFMIETGLRAGEAMALMWNDINIDKHRCSVHSTIVNPHIPSKAYVQDSPKTSASIRTIPLNIRATSILNAIRRRATSEYVFGCSNSGHNNSGRLEYPTLIRAVKKMCKIAGVPYRGAHVFRHTFATNCYYKGVDVKILSKLLGHSDVKITYNTYINLYGDGFDDMYAAICL